MLKKVKDEDDDGASSKRAKTEPKSKAAPKANSKAKAEPKAKGKATEDDDPSGPRKRARGKQAES